MGSLSNITIFKSIHPSNLTDLDTTKSARMYQKRGCLVFHILTLPDKNLVKIHKGGK
jgi:hypothetical protein